MGVVSDRHTPQWREMLPATYASVTLEGWPVGDSARSLVPQVGTLTRSVMEGRDGRRLSCAQRVV